MLAGELIDEARDYHTAFGPNVVQQKMALRRLNAGQRTLARTITAIAEEALATTRVFEAADIEAALTTGTGLDLGHATVLKPAQIVHGEGQVTRCDVLGYTELQDAWFFPAVWLAGGRVRLVDLRERGQPDHGWGDVTELRLLVVETPPVLETDDAELTLPDEARDALVLDLVVFMASRTGVLKQIPHVIDDARAAHEAAVNTIAASGRSGSWRVTSR